MIVLFIALALLTNMNNSKKVSENNPYGKDSLDPETIDLLDDENYQNIILPEELEKNLADQEDLTVYFFASDCLFCKEATPFLHQCLKSLELILSNIIFLSLNKDGMITTLNQHQPLFNLKMVKKLLVSWFTRRRCLSQVAN